MIDKFNRWCLFYDVEVTTSPQDGPLYDFPTLVRGLMPRILGGQSKKLLDRDKRVVRIAQAEIRTIGDKEWMGFVVTIGNENAADPTFVDFNAGTARDAERNAGEVRGHSAHGILSLRPEPGHPRRFRLMLEQSPGLGRTILERLLNSEFAELAEAGRDGFVRKKTGSSVKTRAISHLSAHQSDELEKALSSGTFPSIELIDTTPGATWDEPGKFKSKRRYVQMQLIAPPDGRLEALKALMERANKNGYGRMRVNWKPGGSTRSLPSSEIETDLADLSEAIFTKRVLVTVDTGMSECSNVLVHHFLAKMSAEFAK